MLFFGWLAIKGLTYINPASLEVAESPKPEAAAQPFKIDKPTSSIGLLAIVAASCAATSIMVARQLRPVKPAPRRALKRAQTAPAKEARSLNRNPQPACRPSNLKPTPAQSAPAAIASKSPAHPSIVTVLSVEDENPLEIGDATLAEMMDIRKQA